MQLFHYHLVTSKVLLLQLSCACLFLVALPFFLIWAPDFVVNAGGVIYLALASEENADLSAINARVEAIGDTVATIFADARKQKVTTLEAAERLAAARLGAAS